MHASAYAKCTLYSRQLSEQHRAESAVLHHSHRLLVNMQVRVDAVVALRSFIDAFDTEGLQQVKPLIPQLLDVFFQLMQEVSLPRLTVLIWLWLRHIHAGWSAFSV